MSKKERVINKYQKMTPEEIKENYKNLQNTQGLDFQNILSKTINKLGTEKEKNQIFLDEIENKSIAEIMDEDPEDILATIHGIVQNLNKITDEN